MQSQPEGKEKRKKQIQEIYDKLKEVQTNGNPLTNMMARNLKVFLKIYAEIKNKSKKLAHPHTLSIVGIPRCASGHIM